MKKTLDASDQEEEEKEVQQIVKDDKHKLGKW